VPIKPLIESEGRRTAVIAAVMGLLLLASLAGAYAYTHMISARPLESSTAVHLEQLHLDLPGEWSPSPAGTASGNTAGVLRFHDKSARRIIVASLPPLVGKAAGRKDGWFVALATAGPLLDPRLVSHPSSIEPSETDKRLEVRITGVLTEAGRMTDHEVILFSDDARHYWLVYLVSPLGQRGRGQRAFMDEGEFLDRVMDSVRIDGPTTRPGAESSDPADPGDPR
jgi:hypothetical protein